MEDKLIVATLLFRSLEEYLLLMYCKSMSVWATAELNLLLRLAVNYKQLNIPVSSSALTVTITFEGYAQHIKL